MIEINSFVFSDLKKEVNKYTDDINKVVNDLRSMKDDVSNFS